MHMTESFPTNWTELSSASFRRVLELTSGFHDAGFFDFALSGEYLDIALHPIHFGKEHEYTYHGLNACKLRLSTNHDVSEASLHRASEAFSIMEMRKTDSDLVFSFSTYELKVPVEMTKSCFKFHTIADGQDYWSRGF